MPPKAIHQLNRVFLPPEQPNVGYFCFADRAFYDVEYREFFENKQYIVLDCPVVEEGEILPPRKYKAIVEAIKPTFAIIPDVRFDRRASFAMFMRYMEMMDSPASTGVLQGQDTAEMVDSASELLEAGVRRLAVPRTSAKNGSGLRAAIISEVNAAHPGIDIRWHLLGARFPYYDEWFCSKYHLADSCDSAEAVNAAIRNTHSHLSPTAVARPEGFLELKSVPQEKLIKWLSVFTSVLNLESLEQVMSLLGTHSLESPLGVMNGLKPDDPSLVSPVS